MADRYVIPRGWFPYAQVAKEYLGIGPEFLLSAIKRGELRAYRKPATKASAGKNVSLFICLADVDEWIRTYWQPAAAI